MQKFLSVLLLLIAGLKLPAQYSTSGSDYSNKVRLILICDKYEKSYELLQEYIRSHAEMTLLSDKYTINSAKLMIRTDSAGLVRFNAYVPVLGSIQYKKMDMSVTDEDLRRAADAVSSASAKVVKYTGMITRNDTQIWKRDLLEQYRKNSEQELDNALNKLDRMRLESRTYTIDLDLNNSYMQAGSENDKELGKPRRWVNMPGAEFTMLRIENPTPGTSVKQYQGAQIKYIFTRGKDYMQLGAWRSVNTPSDTTTFRELFMVSFGQDFYSKRWGRGSRRFLNLYTGYNTGILLMSTGKSRVVLPQISPAVGVDIFKTKHVLLDTRVNYFLPLSEKYYESMRGLAFSASFNFVF